METGRQHGDKAERQAGRQAGDKDDGDVLLLHAHFAPVGSVVLAGLMISF